MFFYGECLIDCKSNKQSFNNINIEVKFNMKPNKIYITTLLLLFFLSGRAQKIEELTAVPLPDRV